MKEQAMKEAATMLNEEARRAASTLHQTPGWRWRRELCQTERSQQRTEWAHHQGLETLAVEGNVRRVRGHRPGICREAVPKLESNACRRGNVGRMRGIVRARAQSNARAAGACGWHRQNEIHAGVDSIDSRNLADHGVAVPKRHAGSTAWGRADGSVRASAGKHRQEAITWTSADSPLKLDRLIVRVLPINSDGRGVTVPSLIETICEL